MMNKPIIPLIILCAFLLVCLAMPAWAGSETEQPKVKIKLKSGNQIRTPQGFIRAANEYYDKGQYSKALSIFGEAAKKYPDLPEAWLGKGKSLLRLGRRMEAHANLDKAIYLRPNYAAAFYNKARTYAASGDKKNAIAHLKKSIELDPKYKNKAKVDAYFEAYLKKGIVVKPAK